MTEFRQAIYDVTRAIPPGKVATYGQIAVLAGQPRAARQVGYAMAALDEDSGVPWQRVVNAQGRISARADGQCEPLQQILLEEEGVEFDASGRIDLARFGWDG